MRTSWARETAAAEKAMAANREAIEASVQGIPAGRDKSRSTTAPRGYVLVSAHHPSRCMFCGRKITPGRQVRYWFGIGLTCRSCQLAPKGTAST